MGQPLEDVFCAGVSADRQGSAICWVAEPREECPLGLIWQPTGAPVPAMRLAKAATLSLFCAPRLTEDAIAAARCLAGALPKGVEEPEEVADFVGQRAPPRVARVRPTRHGAVVDGHRLALVQLVEAVGHVGHDAAGGKAARQAELVWVVPGLAVQDEGRAGWPGERMGCGPWPGQPQALLARDERAPAATSSPATPAVPQPQPPSPPAQQAHQPPPLPVQCPRCTGDSPSNPCSARMCPTPAGPHPRMPPLEARSQTRMLTAAPGALTTAPRISPSRGQQPAAQRWSS